MKQENLVESNKYVKTILQRFSMQKSKSIKIHIHVGVKLYVDQCPKIEEEDEVMSQVLYSSVVGSLMYATVCIYEELLMKWNFWADISKKHERSIGKL